MFDKGFRLSCLMGCKCGVIQDLCHGSFPAFRPIRVKACAKTATFLEFFFRFTLQNVF